MSCVILNFFVLKLLKTIYNFDDISSKIKHWNFFFIKSHVYDMDENSRCSFSCFAAFSITIDKTSKIVPLIFVSLVWNLTRGQKLII